MTRELHEAIGKVTIAYSSLDFTIVSFAGQLLASDQRIGQTVFGPMPMSRKIEMLRTLFNLLPSVGCDDSAKALASLKHGTPSCTPSHGCPSRVSPETLFPPF
jgi:hypothetical protein